MATKVMKSTNDPNSIDKEVLIHILPHKLSSHRFKKFIEKCKKNRLPLSEKYTSKVTHIVSELDSVDDVVNRLGLKSCEIAGLTGQKLFLKTQYLSDCLRSGTLVKVCAEHTLLQQNKDAIEVLEKEADLSGDELNYSRSLAFRRCIAVLKAYPSEIKRLSEIKKLPHVGGHCQKVIKEILEDGESDEILKITESEYYQKMKLFTSVFGIGVATARKWIDYGLNEIAEAMNHPLTANIHDQRVIYGVAYYSDLSQPVLRTEANFVVQLVVEEVKELLPGATVVLAGGFRRGKEEGHDIDILISHPEEGREVGLLPKLLQRLNANNLILYGKYDKRSDTNDKLKHVPKGQYLKSSHDEFEKWYGILKLHKDLTGKRESTYDQVKTKPMHQNHSNNDRECTASTNYKSLQGSSSSCTDKQTLARKSSDWSFTGKNSYGKRDWGSIDQSVDNEMPPEKLMRQLAHDNEGHTGYDVGHQTGPGTEYQRGSDIEHQLTVDTGRQTEHNAHMEHQAELNTGHQTVHEMEHQIRCHAGQQPLSKVVQEASVERWWKACRVDLVVCPASQYYYALVGWTGSKFFNRDLRLYAQRKLGMKLSSHALWDSKNSQFLPARSEEEVFQNLHIQYKEPWQRNA